VITFTITDPGFSPEYEHLGFKFQGGKCQVTEEEAPQLRGLHWCEEETRETRTGPPSGSPRDAGGGKQTRRRMRPKPLEAGEEE